MDLLRFQNLSLLFPFALIFLLFCGSLLPSYTAIAVAPSIDSTSDRLALLSFKSLLSDPNGALISWSNDSLYPCRWRGVTCGRRHPHRVTALDLDSLNLAGLISPQLTNLTFLHRIHLPNNQLRGPIPQDLGRLSRLQYLNLSINSLDGQIPASLSHCSRLQIISLWDNKLQGEIPSNLSQCSNLQSLGLSNNSLSGEIPSGFSSLPILETLILSSNNLSCSIPALLGSSSSLSYVDLQDNRLTGLITAFLANSSSLEYLDLSKNSLIGGIPPSLGNTSLEYLDLSKNILIGGIPPSLGNTSSLVFLDLSINGLTGDIPHFLSLRIPSPLLYLGLSINNLTGQIPPSLGNLSSLLIMYLASNSLEGRIPDTVGSIPNLQELDLSDNSLSGPVPSSLYNISSITYFGVGNNRLSGTLPSDMGLTLPNLQGLEMRYNHFHGPIPVSLCNSSGLQTLTLAKNTFSGPVPSNLGYLEGLRQLNIGWNQLEAHDWSFLSSMTNCSLLEQLYLQNNKLEGMLPKSVGNLSTHLQWLLIGNNKIFGTVPDEIGNLVNLAVLYMDQNLFTGNIPANIGKLRNLVNLKLSGNKFSGIIPSSLGNLTQLNELYMQENELSGLIPASFGLCKNLDALNLSHNSLGGSIPKEVVSLSSLTQFLDLSHNYLNGPVPTEVGSLVNLVQLDVSKNQLSGEIPPALGACLLLQYLHLESNFFQGNIPLSFTTLRGMIELDLSCNNLSGPIPEFLEKFGSLQYLNLSFNDFDGEVPKAGVFSNASEISILGNKRLCGGDPMLRLPACPVQSSERRGSSRILIIVITTVVSVVIFSLFFTFWFLYRLRRSGEKCLSYSSSEDKYEKVSYGDIVKATGDFSSANIVGSGSFGYVYKGKMGFDEKVVAVKVLNVDRRGALKSFTAECEVLRNIRHKNLIKIITLCSSVDYKGNDFKALVYVYMPNGSLEKWLHPEGYNPHRSRRLDLIQRLNIAIDVASALEYLHHNCMPPVVHCDLKPSNVLLDNNMSAHVGDFGLARFLVSSLNSTSLMEIKGSIGYVAPEYGMGSHISTQGDVYSYGVLLLEMLTGKKPTDDMFKDGLNLHNFVEMAFSERVIEILDPQILQDEDEETNEIIRNRSAARERMWTCILSLIRVGLRCSDESPRERMDMRDVTVEIRAIKENFSGIEVHEGGGHGEGNEDEMLVG